LVVRSESLPSRVTRLFNAKSEHGKSILLRQRRHIDDLRSAVRRRPTRFLARAAATTLSCALGATAIAQVVPQAPPTTGPRPSEERLDLPQFREPARSPFALPPAPIPPSEPGGLTPGLRVYVKHIEITGNKAISIEELKQITKDYEGRIVSSEDLQTLRNKLSSVYLQKGYVNSGAVLPDQQVKDGTVHYQIIEGALTGIEIAGNERLKSKYLSDRILLGAGPPLNVNELQQRLQILQQDGLIERINAELSPGTQPGEAVVKANIQEALPYQAGISFSNRRPPSVGPYLGELFASHRDLTGWGDTIDARYGLTQGVNDYQVGYAIPVNARDTTVSIRASQTDSLVVESPFNQIDIRSKAKTYQLGLTQPVWRTVTDSFSLGLKYEYRESETTLLGVPFSFSPGVPNGKSEVNVLRFSQDWLNRSPDQVIALRSSFSDGRTNADPQSAGVGPNKSFVAWLGQLQVAQRFDKGGQLIFRTDFQYSPQSLMPIEQIAIGGMSTVRGYRENQLLRDNALIVSAEYRIPVRFITSDKNRLQFAVFADYANSRNSDSTPATPHSIASYGVGLLWEYSRQINAQLYVANPTHKFAQTTHDLQDSGIHFAVTYLLF
jgi:hemolysin activation/secretion protein